MSALDGHVGHAVFDQVLADIHLLMHTTQYKTFEHCIKIPNKD